MTQKPQPQPGQPHGGGGATAGWPSCPQSSPAAPESPALQRPCPGAGGRACRSPAPWASRTLGPHRPHPARSPAPQIGDALSAGEARPPAVRRAGLCLSSGDGSKAWCLGSPPLPLPCGLLLFMCLCPSSDSFLGACEETTGTRAPSPVSSPGEPGGRGGQRPGCSQPGARRAGPSPSVSVLRLTVPRSQGLLMRLTENRPCTPMLSRMCDALTRVCRQKASPCNP